MSKFLTGQNIDEARSAKWNSSSVAFAGHVVRVSIGTADAAEYCHAAADLPWGILINDGTLNNQLTVATEGVLHMRNSLNGTINIGDPVILDYTNSGGTTGFVKSAYYTEAIASAAGDIGTHATATLANKAVPGSIRDTGTNTTVILSTDGVTLVGVGPSGAVGGGNFFYTINQPMIGYAMEKATTPRQLFKVEVTKERFVKNNTVN